MTQLQNGLTALNSAVQNPSQELVDQQLKVQTESQKLQAALLQLQQSSPAMQYVIEAASAGVAKSGTASLTAEGLQSVTAFAKDTTSVSSHAVALLQELEKLTTMLNAQQVALKTNVSTLSAGAYTLTPNVITALSGYTALRTANTQLYDGSVTLANGLTSAYTGSQQLGTGLSTIGANSAALRSGVAQVTDGSDVLATKLAEAAAQVKLQPTGEATQAQLATPLSSVASNEGDVPNYGYALAPYVLSLGLFVGALVFNVIYPIRKTFSEQKNAAHWWLAKASIAGAAAVVQATILMLIMVLFLGLHPEHPVQFAAAIYLTSLTYMSIVTLLVIMFDNVGRFLAMVLLVLQLGASEGTFPIQTAPAFFQTINPFLPMTYSIHTLREAISGGLSGQYYASSMWVLLAILVVTNLALVAFFMYRGRRAFAHTSVDGDN